MKAGLRSNCGPVDSPKDYNWTARNGEVIVEAKE
jgi:hypothetical protein